MRMRWGACSAILVLLGGLAPRGAAASPRRYAWSYGVETGSDGEVGLELWVSNQFPDIHHSESQSWDIWWGGTGSLTDWLELGIFADADQDFGEGMRFDSLHTQLRFRLAPPLAIITDVTFGREGQADNTPGALALLVGRFESGGVDLTGNLGGGYDYSGDGFEVDGSVGASVKTGNYLRVGAESFVRWFPDDDKVSLLAGPTLSLAWARLWVTANASFGREGGNVASASRLIFAILL
jgi:hypothetical protein